MHTTDTDQLYTEPTTPGTLVRARHAGGDRHQLHVLADLPYEFRWVRLDDGAVVTFRDLRDVSPFPEEEL